ncbi:MAG: hypothetical protein M0R22_11285 [Dehalococcoidia bacterium]|nr:hypothetical protein [Dehalococcoidia bacterium]
MRIATFILGILIGGAMFLQSCFAYGVGSYLETIAPEGEVSPMPDATMAVGAAILALAAMAFSLSKPNAAIWIYLLAAVAAWSAHKEGFSDMEMWAGAMVWLAGMCYWSWRELRQQRATA